MGTKLIYITFAYGILLVGIGISDVMVQPYLRHAITTSALAAGSESGNGNGNGWIQASIRCRAAGSALSLPATCLVISTHALYRYH